MCDEVVRIEPCLLEFVLNHFQTKERFDKIVERRLYDLEYIPDQYKTQEVCDGTAER